MVDDIHPYEAVSDGAGMKAAFDAVKPSSDDVDNAAAGRFCKHRTVLKPEDHGALLVGPGSSLQ